jgi:hypothetical protein
MLYIKLDDLPPGLSLARFWSVVRPRSEAGYEEAIAMWKQIFAHWERKGKGLS